MTKQDVIIIHHKSQTTLTEVNHKIYDSSFNVHIVTNMISWSLMFILSYKHTVKMIASDSTHIRTAPFCKWSASVAKTDPTKAPISSSITVNEYLEILNTGTLSLTSSTVMVTLAYPIRPPPSVATTESAIVSLQEVNMINHAIIFTL